MKYIGKLLPWRVEGGYLRLVADVVGLGGIVFFLAMWWAAALSSTWTSSAVFNRFGEHWIEGFLFHAGLVVVIYLEWRAWRNRKKG